MNSLAMWGLVMAVTKCLPLMKMDRGDSSTTQSIDSWISSPSSFRQTCSFFNPDGLYDFSLLRFLVPLPDLAGMQMWFLRPLANRPSLLCPRLFRVADQSLLSYCTGKERL